MKKEFRVKKSEDIEKILNRKNSVGDSYFSVYKRETVNQPHFRFAVSVSKKFGGAVERNRIKRRVREVVKVLKFIPNVDVFIIIKSKSNTLSFQEIQTDLEKLFARAKILEV